MEATDQPEPLYVGLPERLVGLDLCSIAVWVFDNERGRLPWANKEALKLFNAATRGELAARDMSDFSAASLARFVHIRSEFSAGRDVWETWTLYPKGEPKKIKLHLAPFALADGRIIYLAEAFPIENPEIPADSRGIEALRHTAAMVTMLDSTGAIVLKNPAAVRAFEAMPFSTWFTDSAITATISAVLAQDEPYRTTALARTAHGERWHLIEARRVLDPVSGQRLILLDQIDITVQQLQALTIARQHEEIRALSAPLLPIGQRTLALPLIGSFDTERAAWIIEKVLTEITAHRIRYLIIDLTGIGAFAAAFGQHLARLISAVALLGAKPVMSGILPGLAKLLVSAGIELSEVVVCRDLQQAIALCTARE